MTKKYLVKIKPLEPYFFGDENTIRIGEENRYYVSSLLTPTATTIMGMLRYVILEQNGLLQPNGIYNDKQYEKNVEYIGASSFVPGYEENYGYIKSVSPLFLMKGNEKFIKTPLNHKTSETKYTALKLNREVETSYGKIVMPAEKEYDVKNTVGDNSYVNIVTGEIVKNDYEKNYYLFKPFEKITCQKNSKENGFMKKVFQVLDKDFCFAVIAELDEKVEFANTTCSMGREKSSFALEASSGFDICKEIEDGYIGKNSCGFSYAFGDIVLKEKPNYTAFAMINTKNLRYLQTEGNNTKISRSGVLHNVVSAGSIFYNDNDVNPYGNDKFGLNKIITFGGK